MRDKNERGALRLDGLKEQVRDLAAGAGVEVAGRLVGDEDGRFDGKRARDRDPLLLAAGKLRGVVRKTAAKADPLKHRTRPVERIAAAGKLQRHGHILQCIHGLHQMEGLEYEADLASAEAREPVLPDAGIVEAGDGDAAAVDPLKACDHHEQSGFPRTGRPDEADALAVRHGEVHAMEDMHAGNAGPKRQVHLVQQDGRFIHRRAAYIGERSSAYGSRMNKFKTLRLLAAALVAGAFCGFALPAAAEPVEIVALGDSLSAGFGVGPGEAFPEQLQAALRERGHDVNVANAGVSGDTASDGLARLEWSVPADADIVIVELGANDALRGIDPAVTRDALSKIVSTLKGRGQAVLLAGMLAPRNLGPEYSAEFDMLYPELAAEHDVELYPFFLEGVATEAALNQPDGGHPTAAGIAVIVESILPYVESLIADVTAGD